MKGFGNPDNPRAHEDGTGLELWRQTDGRITHFVSAMGTTGTITGVSRFLKSRSPGVQIVGAQPAPGSRIPGIRAWSPVGTRFHVLATRRILRSVRRLSLAPTRPEAPPG